MAPFAAYLSHFLELTSLSSLLPRAASLHGTPTQSILPRADAATPTAVVATGPHETSADTPADMEITTFSHPKCIGQSHVFKDIKYSIGTTISVSTESIIGAQSFKLSRPLGKGEQLDFSRRKPGPQVKDQAEIDEAKKEAVGTEVDPGFNNPDYGTKAYVEGFNNMTQYARVTLTNAVMVNSSPTPGATNIKMRMKRRGLLLDGEDDDDNDDDDDDDDDDVVGLGVMKREGGDLTGGLEDCAKHVRIFKEGEAKGQEDDGCVNLKAQANCFRLWKVNGN